MTVAIELPAYPPLDLTDDVDDAARTIVHWSMAVEAGVAELTAALAIEGDDDLPQIIDLLSVWKARHGRDVQLALGYMEGQAQGVVAVRPVDSIDPPARHADETDEHASGRALALRHVAEIVERVPGRWEIAERLRRHARHIDPAGRWS